MKYVISIILSPRAHRTIIKENIKQAGSMNSCGKFYDNVNIISLHFPKNSNMVNYMINKINNNIKA